MQTKYHAEINLDKYKQEQDKTKKKGPITKDDEPI